jgi:Flp pilus assembly pilin Flp
MSLFVSWLNHSHVLRLPSVAAGSLGATFRSHVLMEGWLAFLCMVISWRDISAAIRALHASAAPVASLLHSSCRGHLRAAAEETEVLRPFSSLWADELGATMADYAMLLALVAVSLGAAVQALRTQIEIVIATTASTLGTIQ